MNNTTHPHKMKSAILVLLISFLSIAGLAQQQNLNVGTSANDHTGDPLRTLFQKSQANFTELYTQAIRSGTAGGTNTYPAMPDPPASLTDNQGAVITFTNGNTASSTLNLNGLGAKTLKKWSSGSLVNLVAGDIPAGSKWLVFYDATNAIYQINIPPAGGSGGGDMLAANNLSDLASASTARTNLGLGTLATQNGTFSGTSSGTNTGDQTSVTGNAGTATALQTARTINGVSFDGTANITVPAAASTLTGNLSVTNFNSGTSASSTTFWAGDASWKVPFILTTTGSSGPATFSSGTLNIPQYSAGGGTVTTVTGTSPISITSTPTTTPNVTISQATTSTNGYVSSTDWNTFNNKQNALVSGTNIKSINNSPLPGSGNLELQTGIQLSELGTIYSDNYNRGSLGANYTQTGGTASFSIVSNALVVSGGVNTLAQFITRSDYKTNLDQWDRTINLTLGTITSTSYGIGFGTSSVATQSTTRSSLVCSIDLTNTSAQGSIYWGYNIGGTLSTVRTSVAKLSVSTGDVLIFKLSRSKNLYTCYVKNVTTGLTLVDTYTFSQVNDGAILNMPNAGYFSIHALGGTQTLTSDIVTSPSPVSADWMLIGNSISAGTYTDQTNNKWFEKLSQTYKGTFIVNAGGGNQIEDVNTAEVLALAPKKIVIASGINNIFNGDNLTTFQTKYSALVTSLTSGGYVLGTDLFVALLLPSNGAVVTTYNAWLLSTYTSAVIDLNTPMRASTGTGINAAYSSDGTHPNQIGAQVLGLSFANAAGLTKKNFPYINYNPVFANAVISGRLPYYFNDVLSNTNLYYSATNGNFGIGISPLSNTAVHADKNFNGDAVWFMSNSNVGSSTDAAFKVGVDATNSGVNYLSMTILGTGATASGLVGPKVGIIEQFSGSNMLISNFSNADMIFATNSRTERFRIKGDGKIGVNVSSPFSLLDVSGSFGSAITTVTSNTTLDATHYTVLCDATSGNIAISLPAASTVTRRIYIIKKIDSSGNTVSFTTADGSITLSTQWSGKQIQSNGTSYYVTGSF